ncbi:hypothetical protein [Deinococcus aerophilus]|uniref:Uncharacterized protein n=1 Tax=Deinococcus aerophilus TaxID=522488 RepID=A0ABQ2GZK3_9DEIO|nr:hypothetical protein [Deinococcus aerophilus]GGM20090.1 hypothetical protein GCM10010841_30160 [Deinococcus aerophilus]
MTGWTYRNLAALTLPIGTDAAADRARAAGLWPTTSAVGSVGGHDNERVATELASEFQADHSAVLILWRESHGGYVARTPLTELLHFRACGPP